MTPGGTEKKKREVLEKKGYPRRTPTCIPDLCAFWDADRCAGRVDVAARRRTAVRDKNKRMRAAGGVA